MGSVDAARELGLPDLLVREAATLIDRRRAYVALPQRPFLRTTIGYSTEREKFKQG
jgi:hypothetical protein